jgi:hypothetical protein
VTSWVQVDPERVPDGFSWLHGVFLRAEGKDVWLDGVDVVDGEVDMKLLRPSAGRPCWRGKICHQLKRQSQLINDHHNPVVLVVSEVASDKSLVKRGQGTRSWTVENDGP